MSESGFKARLARFALAVRRSPIRQKFGWLVPVLIVAAMVFLLSPGLTGLRSPEAEEDSAKGGAGALASLSRSSIEEIERFAALPPPYAEDFTLPSDGRGAASRDDPDDAADDASESDLGSIYDCIIEPSEMVEIGSAITAVIEELAVERSDVVEAGAVVARLEAGVEQAAVDLAKARAQMDGEVRARIASLQLGERRNKRVNELFEHNTLSLDLREQAATEAEIARLELEEAHDQKRLASLELRQAMAVLKRRLIRSPISGVVVERLKTAGEVVDQETILTVAQIDPLMVEVILPAALFGSIPSGMRAAVEPEFPGDRVHVASVSVVDRVIDAASGTFGVRLELPNPDHAIPGGLHCQVRFLTE